MSAKVPGSETLTTFFLVAFFFVFLLAFFLVAFFFVFLLAFFLVAFFFVFLLAFFLVAFFFAALADDCEDPRPRKGIASKAPSSLSMSLLLATIESLAPVPDE